MAISDSEDIKVQARELLLRARLFKLFAVIFALMGLFVFCLLFMRHINGNLEQALQRPSTVVIIFMPFLPAFILSFLAKRSEKEFFGFIRTQNEKIREQNKKFQEEQEAAAKQAQEKKS